MRKCKQIIATVLLAALSLAPLTLQGHYDTAYWHETTPTQTRTGWMHTVPDNRRLSDLNVPGTHASMAYTHGVSNYLTQFNQTQSMPLNAQLQSGIRALDIELNARNGRLEFYHDTELLSQSFESFMNTLEDFVVLNPTETVFVHVNPAQRANITTLAQTFTSNLTHYDFIYRGTNTNPTLADMRGKVVFISEIPNLQGVAINPKMSIQDDDFLHTNWDLYDRWLKIKGHADLTNAGHRNGTLYMNYLNGEGGSTPYFVASGHISPGTKAARLSTGFTEPAFKGKYPDFPRVDRLGVFATIAFEGTNILYRDHIGYNATRHVGFVMADFPGVNLINLIIDIN